MDELLVGLLKRQVDSIQSVTFMAHVFIVGCIVPAVARSGTVVSARFPGQVFNIGLEAGRNTENGDIFVFSLLTILPNTYLVQKHSDVLCVSY